MRELNSKQTAFCHEYVRDKRATATQVAIRAGYSPKTAHVHACRLLKNDNCKALIKELLEKQTDKFELTIDYVIQKVVKVIDESIDQPVLDKNGNQVYRMVDGEKVPVVRTDKAAVLKGTEILGKHLGMFTENINVKGDIITRVQGMSDEELDAKINAIMQKING